MDPLSYDLSHFSPRNVCWRPTQQRDNPSIRADFDLSSNQWTVLAQAHEAPTTHRRVRKCPIIRDHWRHSVEYWFPIMVHLRINCFGIFACLTDCTLELHFVRAKLEEIFDGFEESALIISVE